MASSEIPCSCRMKKSKNEEMTPATPSTLEMVSNSCIFQRTGLRSTRVLS